MFVKKDKNGADMTHPENSSAKYSEYNSKKAYYAMCKAVILLFVFTLLSYLANMLLSLCFGRYSYVLQNGLVRLLSFFGVPGLSAIALSKTLLTSYALSEVIQMLVVGITVLVPTCIFARCAGLSGDECFNLKGKFVKGLYPALGLCQMTIMFVLVLSNSFSDVFFDPVFGSHGYGAAYGGASSAQFNVFEFAISVICTCVFVPLAEEFTFRGVLFSYLGRYGTAFGMVASSLIFGVAHSEPEQAVFAFGFGMMASFFVVVTGNIKTAVLCHALNNFLYVIVDAAYGTPFYVFVVIFRMSLFVSGFFGIRYLLRRGGYMDKFSEQAEKNDALVAVKPGIREVFCVPMIVFILLNAAVYLGEIIK